jgi:hypothetical protein
MTNVLLALDPGGTTGVAIHDERGIMTRVTHKPWELYDLIENLHPDTCVFEDFHTVGHISTDGLYTVRLIGGVEAVTNRLSIPTILQHPQERYPMLPPAKAMLKASGRKYLVHELDALAHLLLYEHRTLHNQHPIRRRTNGVCK